MKISHSLISLEKAYKSLKEAVDEPIKNNRDKAGIIKKFEFVYELSWKAMKRKLEDEGQITSTPRDVINRAFKNDYILDENLWLEIIKDRNLAVHTYDQQLADLLVERIQKKYTVGFLRVLIFLKNR